MFYFRNYATRNTQYRRYNKAGSFFYLVLDFFQAKKEGGREAKKQKQK